ncbi:MAG: hypothetical protein EXR60_03500 [Dehalococcoidia bacterium]|nr:hypothetical protein [Dehalococcoidia bacterium]
MKGLTRSLVSLVALLAILGAMVPFSLRTAQPALAGNQNWSSLANPAHMGVGRDVGTPQNISGPAAPHVAADGTIFVAINNPDLAGADANEPDAVVDDLAFSTNQGTSFTILSSGTQTFPWNGSAIVVIRTSPNFVSDRGVLVAYTAGGIARVAFSSDGGSSFTDLASATAGNGFGDMTAVIDMAVAPNFSGGTGRIALAGASGGALNGLWQGLMTVGAMVAGIEAVANPVSADAGDASIAVSFSPNFVSDGLLFGVHVESTANAANNCQAVNRVCVTRSVVPAAAAQGALGDSLAAANFTQATTNGGLVFPSGYNNITADNFFVGVSGGTAAQMDLYRRFGGAWGALDPDGAAGGSAVNSFAVSGSFTAGVIWVVDTIAGTGGAVTIRRSGDGGATWPADGVSLLAGQTAGSGRVVVDPGNLNNVYVTTFGAQGAFYASTTGGGTTASWTGRGLFTENLVNNLSLDASADGATVFAIYGANAGFDGTTAVYRTTSATGATWQRVLATPGVAVGSVSVSPNFATDNTVWVGGIAGTMLRSVDGGLTFSNAGLTAVPTGGTLLGGIGVKAVDSTKAFGLATGGRIHRTVNSGASWTTVTLAGAVSITDIDISPAFATDGHVLVASRSPATAAQVWLSKDGGVTFTEVGTSPDTATTLNQAFVAFDSAYATNKTIYAGTDSDVFRWTVDTSTTWRDLDSNRNVPGTPTGIISQLASASVVTAATGLESVGGRLYVFTGAGAGGFRAINPTATYDGTPATWLALEFAAVANAGVNNTDGGLQTLGRSLGTAATATAAATLGIWTGLGRTTLARAQATGTLLMAIDQNPAAPTTVTPQAIPALDSIKVYLDQMLTAPTITSPTNGAVLLGHPGSALSLPVMTWTPVAVTPTADPLRYEVQWSTAAAFDSVANTALTITGLTQLNVQNGIQNQALTAGTTYYLRVRTVAWNNTGGNAAPQAAETIVHGPWSAVVNYGASILPGNILLYPASAPGQIQTVDSLAFGFSWSAVVGATDYRVQVATDPTLEAAFGGYRSPVLNKTVGSATPSLQLLGNELQAGKTYYWQMAPVYNTNLGPYTNLSAQAGASGVFRTLAAVATTVDVATATSSIVGAFDIVWRFDNANQRWMSYTPGAPAFAQTLTNIMPGQPVWIYGNRVAVWTRGGNTVNLVLGWNLIVAP